MSVYWMIFFGILYLVLAWWFWRIFAVSKLTNQLIEFTGASARETIRAAKTLEELNKDRYQEYWDWYKCIKRK